MNWVGGSRSRCVKNREDTIKQRAFFQKQRMKIKSNIMDSAKGQNSGNMDLLTLFIVNQIASKKEKTGKPKINPLIGEKRTKKALNEPLELPMSPCSPSKLNLVTSQPQYSVDTPGFKIRKHRLVEKFKFKPLSPVLESNLSDASGSEYQHQPSSTSNGSSDPVQPQNTPHVPSTLPCRENPDNNTHQYVSFSQPTNLNNPWTVASNEAPEQDLPHNSPVVGIQFESTLPNPEMEEDSVTSVLYPLTSEQPEEPLFIDFKDIDCEEQKKEEMWKARVKLARCDSPRLESVMRNPVKDVKHAGEPVKEKKKFTAEKGVNRVSEETEKHEAADILLTLKHRKD